jgi:hypothetical protein
MNPVSSRRYRVKFIDYSIFEVFVLAESKADALVKAQALYVADGLTGLSVVNHETEWMAQEVQS